MTRDEILALPAGPALDALVAEHVMGWRDCHLVTSDNPAMELGWRWEGVQPGDPDETYSCGADHSTDIAAAWAVKEAIDGRRFSVRLAFYAALDDTCGSRETAWPWRLRYLTPETLCRAALLAVLAP